MPLVVNFRFADDPDWSPTLSPPVEAVAVESCTPAAYPTFWS
jgi:hypothetical protein